MNKGKILAMIVTLAMFAVVFTGCAACDGDSGNRGGSGNLSLVGTWEMVGYEVDGAMSYLHPSVYTFDADGTGSITNLDRVTEFEWELNGDTLTKTFEWSVTNSVITISDGRLYMYYGPSVTILSRAD